MPRVSGGRGDGGLLVEGIYGEMLAYHRAETDRDERHGVQMLAEFGFQFRKPTVLLRSLEAGKAVIVQRRWAESARGRGFRLPWDRSVKSVSVSPDDVVRPTEEAHPWYGCAAEDSSKWR